MRDHRELRVFQNADELVLQVYTLAARMPRDELYGLTAQMKRSAVSVAANIVEGCGRDTDRDLVRFLYNAYGSLRETGYHINVAARLGFLPKDEADKTQNKIAQTSRQLAAYIKSIKSRFN